MLSLLIVIAVLFSSTQAATTKKPPLCGTCMPRTVVLTPADGTPGSITPTIKMLANTAQGCRQMNIICTTPAGYSVSNMEFNNFGPPPKTGKNIATLVSCFKGMWRTTYQGSYIDDVIVRRI
ncbi:unnamed protein product [Cylicostephanus goldi]|uniref:C6 domain-containing protein n=1 Tax=Cylicostephanus goldi TaxID=71465 RepID=A0A3P7MLB4_CYLGO|nr:unnamed protein product [Cylicostephanus goldi]